MKNLTCIHHSLCSVLCHVRVFLRPPSGNHAPINRCRTTSLHHLCIMPYCHLLTRAYSNEYSKKLNESIRLAFFHLDRLHVHLHDLILVVKLHFGAGGNYANKHQIECDGYIILGGNFLCPGNDSFV